MSTTRQQGSITAGWAEEPSNHVSLQRHDTNPAEEAGPSSPQIKQAPEPKYRHDAPESNNNNNNNRRDKGAGASGRSKNGCISCRVRKKRCDEGKPTCETCARLGLECLGYGARRPKWLKGDDNSLKARRELKAQIMANRGMVVGAEGESPRRRRRTSERQGSTPSHIEAKRSSASPPQTSTDTPDMWTSYMQASPVKQGPAAPAPRQDFVNTQDTRMDNSVNGVSDPGQDTFTAMAPPTALVDFSNAYVGNGELINLAPPVDPSMEDMWRILFGPTSHTTPAAPVYQPRFAPTISPLAVPHAPIYLPFPLGTPAEELSAGPVQGSYLPIEAMGQSTRESPDHLSSTQTIPATDTLLPDLSYLHHYLNVVLPLQYRFAFRAIAELVTPLAVAHPDVLNAVSSLAAMHLVTQRTKAPMSIAPSSAGSSAWGARPSAAHDVQADRDAKTARSFHAGSLQRLRYLSSKDLTSEDVIVSALFAISFYLFSGGTGKGWIDVLETARRCLASALAASPEITSGIMNPNSNSPWKRYRPLILVMIWMDVFGSVTQNRATRGLETYRVLLTHFPSQAPTNRVRLHMETVMGCDDTTFLAIVEIVQLSEWRERMECAGCLSIKELLSRATVAEKILDERAFRESGLGQGASIDVEVDGVASSPTDSLNHGMDDRRVVKVMSDIFYSAAKVLLASVINGPWPRVPELAAAVEETISSLSLLDLHLPPPGPDINRALIFPITLAGCHAASVSQHEFFRSRFTHLGPEATAFGNTQQALQLMEEVWARRAAGGEGQRVDWRQTMRDLGWEAGILLV